MVTSKNLEKLQEEMRLRHAQKLDVPPEFRDIYQAKLKAGEIAEDCRCGRKIVTFYKTHCPNCGRASSMVFAKPEIRTLPAGETVSAIKYRCRGCTLVYTDVDMFLHCEAPPDLSTMKEVRAKQKQEELVQSTFGKYGIEGSEDLINRIKELREKREKGEAE